MISVPICQLVTGQHTGGPSVCALICTNKADKSRQQQLHWTQTGERHLTHDNCVIMPSTCRTLLTTHSHKFAHTNYWPTIFSTATSISISRMSCTEQDGIVQQSVEAVAVAWRLIWLARGVEWECRRFRKVLLLLLLLSLTGEESNEWERNTLSTLQQQQQQQQRQEIMDDEHELKGSH